MWRKIRRLTIFKVIFHWFKGSSSTNVRQEDTVSIVYNLLEKCFICVLEAELQPEFCSPSNQKILHSAWTSAGWPVVSLLFTSFWNPVTCQCSGWRGSTLFEAFRLPGWVGIQLGCILILKVIPSFLMNIQEIKHQMHTTESFVKRF